MLYEFGLKEISIIYYISDKGGRITSVFYNTLISIKSSLTSLVL